MMFAALQVFAQYPSRRDGVDSLDSGSSLDSLTWMSLTVRVVKELLAGEAEYVQRPDGMGVTNMRCAFEPLTPSLPIAAPCCSLRQLACPSAQHIA